LVLGFDGVASSLIALRLFEVDEGRSDRLLRVQSRVAVVYRKDMLGKRIGLMNRTCFVQRGQGMLGLAVICDKYDAYCIICPSSTLSNVKVARRNWIC
jgi:hypothetical protein